MGRNIRRTEEIKMIYTASILVMVISYSLGLYSGTDKQKNMKLYLALFFIILVLYLILLNSKGVA